MEQSQKISLRDIFSIVFTKLHVFKWIFFLVFVVTNAVAFLSSPIYKVTARILLKPSFESSLLFEAPTRTLQAQPVTPLQINSEISIMQSTEVLSRVVTDLDLSAPEPSSGLLSKVIAKPKQWMVEFRSRFGPGGSKNPMEEAVLGLKSSLAISPVTMSNMIDVTMSGKNPEKITNIVNTFVDRYIDQHIHVHQAPEGERFFTAEAEGNRSKLVEAENSLQEFQRRWAVNDATAQRDSFLGVLKLLRENLVITNGKIAEQETRLNQSTTNQDAMTKENIQNPVLSDLTRTLLPLLVEKSRIATLYPVSSVEYQDVNNQVVELTSRIKREMSNFLAGSKIDLNALIDQKKEFERAITSIEERCAMLSEKEVELKRMQRNIAEHEKNYLLYRQKAEEARIEKQKDLSRVSNVSVASWAVKPSVPVFPKKFLMALLSVVVGFFLGVAGTFIAYYMDHTIKTPGDLERQTGITVLSSINMMGNHR